MFVYMRFSFNRD